MCLFRGGHGFPRRFLFLYLSRNTIKLKLSAKEKKKKTKNITFLDQNFRPLNIMSLRTVAPILVIEYKLLSPHHVGSVTKVVFKQPVQIDDAL